MVKNLLYFILGMMMFAGKTIAGQPGLDPRFGIEGLVHTSVSDGEDHAEVVVTTRDKKILVAGVADVYGTSDFALVRYAWDGQLDLKFGHEGRVVLDLGGIDRVFGLAVYPDGRAVVGGYTERNGKKDFALARFLPDGKPDLRFGNQGKVITPKAGEDEIHYLVLDPQGRIVVAGFSQQGRESDFVLARYLNQGQLDESFGEGGWSRLDLSKKDYFYGLTLLPQGGNYVLLATGSVLQKGRKDDCVVGRFDSHGRRDKDFGYGGVAIVSFGRTQDVCSSVMTDSQGRILVGGFMTAPKNDGPNFALARLTPQGLLDDSFGRAGLAILDFDSGPDVIHALALLPSGRIMAAGEASVSQKRGETSVVALAQYAPNGVVDTQAHYKGRITTDFGGDFKQEATSMTALPDGSVLVVGFAKKNFIMAKYTPNFSLPQRAH